MQGPLQPVMYGAAATGVMAPGMFYAQQGLGSIHGYCAGTIQHQLLHQQTYPGGIEGSCMEAGATWGTEMAAAAAAAGGGGLDIGTYIQHPGQCLFPMSASPQEPFWDPSLQQTALGANTLPAAAATPGAAQLHDPAPQQVMMPLPPGWTVLAATAALVAAAAAAGITGAGDLGADATSLITSEQQSGDQPAIFSHGPGLLSRPARPSATAAESKPFLGSRVKESTTQKRRQPCTAEVGMGTEEECRADPAPKRRHLVPARGNCNGSPELVGALGTLGEDTRAAAEGAAAVDAGAPAAAAKGAAAVDAGAPAAGGAAAVDKGTVAAGGAAVVDKGTAAAAGGGGRAAAVDEGTAAAAERAAVVDKETATEAAGRGAAADEARAAVAFKQWVQEEILAVPEGVSEESAAALFDPGHALEMHHTDWLQKPSGKVDGLQVVRKLGEGGNGSVWRVRRVGGAPAVAAAGGEAAGAGPSNSGGSSSSRESRDGSTSSSRIGGSGDSMVPDLALKVGVLYSDMDPVYRARTPIGVHELNVQKGLTTELDTLTAITSHRVIKCYGYGWVACKDGSHVQCLLLELAEGGSLDQLVRPPSGGNRGLGPETTHKVMQGLVCAILDVHNSGVYHRDIKCSNIGLTGEPSRDAVKLIDFGAALLLGTKVGLCGISWRVGTPVFKAPEMQTGWRHDARVDLYMMGLTMVEMRFGDPCPFYHLWCEKDLVTGVPLTAEQRQEQEQRRAYLVAEVVRPDCPYNQDGPGGRVKLTHTEQHFLQGCLRSNPCQRQTALELKSHEYILWGPSYPPCKGMVLLEHD